MEGNDNTEKNLAEITEGILPIHQSNHEHDNLDFCDTFDNSDTPLMSILNVNHIDSQNQKPEEIIENNIYTEDNFNDIMDSFLDGLTPNNEEYQPVTTNLLYTEDLSHIQHLIEKNPWNHELNVLNRLDDVWTNRMEILRMNENRLIGRNVPRLMLFSNDYCICHVNGALHILLNAPVFLRIMRKLQKISEGNIANLQLIKNISHLDNNVQAKSDLFYILSKIVKMIFEENQNDDADIRRLLQVLGHKYQALYSYVNDWIQQDPDNFYIHMMDVLKLGAYATGQTESYSEALEITSSVSIDGRERTVTKDHAIHVQSNNHDFPEYINQHYTGTVVEREGDHLIERNYERLPKQLFATPESQQNGNHVPYPYPAEFITSHNQRYLFTGAVAHNAVSLSCDHCIVVICRQDCVYLFNGHRLVDRFHINYLPTFFKAVHVQALLYTEVDSLGEHICTFEDPLPGIIAGELYNATLCYCQTEKLTTSTPSNISVEVSTVIIRHPILSTFRYYMHSDFRHKNIKTKIPILKDCLERNSLYFWPRSMFAGSFIECTLIFKAPDGNFYRSHYEFVRNEPSGIKFENPTYISIEDKNDVSNDEWFPLNLTISKSKQEAFEAKDEHKNDINLDNRHTNICQIVHYLDGKTEKIDQEKFLSLTKDGGKKRTGGRRFNNDAQKLTTGRLSKVIDPNTLYLAFRRARWLPNEKRYVPDSDNLFYSNAFKPVASSVRKIDHLYNFDLLQITELSPLQIALYYETDMCTIHLSYSISEMYKCTSLKDKYIQITIVTGADKDPPIHPIYQILNKQCRVSSMILPATEYSSILTINIVKHTMNAFLNDSKLRGMLTNPSISEQTTAVPVMTKDDLQRIFISHDMNGFRIQLELCHLSNDDLIIYTKSTVISQRISDESVSQERHVPPELLEIDNAQPDVDLINDSSLHVKRLFDEEVHVSSDISSMKCQKLT